VIRFGDERSKVRFRVNTTQWLKWPGQAEDGRQWIEASIGVENLAHFGTFYA